MNNTIYAYISRFLIIVFFTISAISIPYCLYLYSDNSVNTVNIFTKKPIQLVKNSAIENTLNNVLYNNKWREVSTNQIQKIISSIDGLTNISVLKKWPSTINIYFCQDTPIAFWGNYDAVITKKKKHYLSRKYPEVNALPFIDF